LTTRTTFDLTHAIDLLRRTPAVLDHLLRDVDETWSRATEGPDTFSPFDVVGHLIDGEETDWITRAHVIRDGRPDATFAPYDRFRHRARNAQRTLTSLLEEFAALRAANLVELQSWRLTDADLVLTATHPAFGTVTLRQLLATWVVHDLGHIAQITRVMAKQYRDEIGPWAAFLPIVTDRVRSTETGNG
jgi:hypothetical protein